jgi:hypothetical protein
MFVLAPYSAQAATTIAKMIPNTVIIFPFLSKFINQIFTFKTEGFLKAS